jgi:hypothetical protein
LSNRDKRTLLDKMFGLLRTVSIATSFYFVADAYYAAGKVVKGLLKQDHHLPSLVKSNAVAYQPAEPPKGQKRRGAPKRYGKKIKIKSLLSDPRSMQEALRPACGEDKVMLRYRVCDLLWRPAAELVRLVAVMHPTRGPLLLMCTDLSLGAIDIIHLYGLRFKIEHCFKQAIRLIGSFAYHFWMRGMVPLRHRNGNWYLHRQSDRYRGQVKRKVAAYHVFIQPEWSPKACSNISRRCRRVAMGIVRLLAANLSSRHPPSNGRCPGVAPDASGFSLGFLQNLRSCKFIADRQDTQNMKIFRLTA